MSKIAEQKALELYPDDPYDEYLDQIAGNKRDGYVDGYDQAMQDFLEKACEWIKTNWRHYVWKDGDDIPHFGHWEKDFRKAMEEQQ